MQTLRFPFYVRTMDELGKARALRDSLGLQLNAALTKHPYRFRNVEVNASNLRRGKGSKMIPLSEPNGKKWPCVLVITAVGHKAIGEPNIFQALEDVGLEPIRPTKPEQTFETGAEVSVSIGSLDKMRLIASALDKKVGQGNWRMRGANGYKKRLTEISKGKKRGLLRLMSGNDEKPASVPIKILVSKDVNIPQIELEKMIFTINLKV